MLIVKVRDKSTARGRSQMSSKVTITLEEILVARINEIVRSSLSSHLVQACEEFQEEDK